MEDLAVNDLLLPPDPKKFVQASDTLFVEREKVHLQWPKLETDNDVTQHNSLEIGQELYPVQNIEVSTKLSPCNSKIISPVKDNGKRASRQIKNDHHRTTNE